MGSQSPAFPLVMTLPRARGLAATHCPYSFIILVFSCAAKRYLKPCHPRRSALPAKPVRVIDRRFEESIDTHRQIYENAIRTPFHGSEGAKSNRLMGQREPGAE
jgi:hypothetical protein